KKVLITGSSGLIGGIVSRGLADKYDVSGVDIRPSPGITTHIADMRDLDAIQPAFEGKDAVVDLAALIAVDSTWENVHANNLPATYNAYEASRRAGVKRVVFASSNHTAGMWEFDPPYKQLIAGDYTGLDPKTLRRVTVDMPVRPDGPYGIGKVFGEATGRFYSDQHGLSVLCMRIGTVNPEGRPITIRQLATILTHRDLVQLVDRCISAPDSVRFGVVYGISNNTWRFWDIEGGRKLIGYQPQDDGEQWRDKLPKNA
ncbi:MAG: NAD(P)-dependent oxidoreductase, partial [SAR202 cluster bacterium]|nr:NAD(P)-dependent oxidoreductase [SAR202 cluster bacterium]